MTSSLTLLLAFWHLHKTTSPALTLEANMSHFDFKRLRVDGGRLTG